MAAPQKVDDVCAILGLDRMREADYYKLLSAAVSAHRPFCFWQMPQKPTGGSLPTKGLANGRVLTRTTQGAIGFSNPTGGRSLRLGFNDAHTKNNASDFKVMLVDRISDLRVDHTQTTGGITGFDATSRLDSGMGAKLFCEVAVSVGTTVGNNATRTLTYVNQDGGTSVTPAFVTAGNADGATLGTSPVSTFVDFVPLADGDTGIRSGTTLTLSSSAGSPAGELLFSLVIPIASWTVGRGAVGHLRRYNHGATLPPWPRIRDDACLTFLAIPPASLSAAAGMAGSFGLMES